MVVVLSGLPASGKSTLAEELGRRLGLAVLSVDPIEAAILRAGIARSFETGLAAYLVAEALADAQLALGHGVVIDAVNAEEEGKAIWRDLARRRGVTPRIIECHCPNLALHRQRLASRRRSLDPRLVEPTWDDVERRRLVFTAWPEPVLRIDTAQPLEVIAERAVRWLVG